MLAVQRRIDKQNKIESAVRALLEGPSPDELKHGCGSEIPGGTILLGVTDKGDKININLSKRFASGGGIDSIEARIQQLSQTIKGLAGNRDVFLDIEGHRLTMTPGEGVEVKQPINK